VNRDTSTPDPRQAELDAARLLLDRMGITAADLLTTPRQRPPLPTFGDYIPQIRDAVSTGTSRVYGSYWNRILDRWGTLRLGEITPTDIKRLVEHTKIHVVARRNARGGRSAREHSSPRCVVSTDTPRTTGSSTRPRTRPARWPNRADYPAPVGPCPTSGWRKSTERQRPPATIPLSTPCCSRLHIETACRRGGALALRPQDLDPQLTARYRSRSPAGHAAPSARRACAATYTMNTWEAWGLADVPLSPSGVVLTLDPATAGRARCRDRTGPSRPPRGSRATGRRSRSGAEQGGAEQDARDQRTDHRWLLQLPGHRAQQAGEHDDQGDVGRQEGGPARADQSTRSPGATARSRRCIGVGRSTAGRSPASVNQCR
jgi:hypothetical protein